MNKIFLNDNLLKNNNFVYNLVIEYINLKTEYIKHIKNCCFKAFSVDTNIIDSIYLELNKLKYNYININPISIKFFIDDSYNFNKILNSQISSTHKIQNILWYNENLKLKSDNRMLIKNLKLFSDNLQWIQTENIIIKESKDKYIIKLENEIIKLKDKYNK